MAHVIQFTSEHFDPAKERPNPVNPIAGEGVLRWLKEKLEAHGYEATAPDTEDWGWYMDVSRDGAHYLVGASGEPGDGRAPVEWTVQIHKHRTLKDRLMGRNTLAADDTLTTLLETLLRESPGAPSLNVQREKG